MGTAVIRGRPIGLKSAGARLVAFAAAAPVLGAPEDPQCGSFPNHLSKHHRTALLGNPWAKRKGPGGGSIPSGPRLRSLGRRKAVLQHSVPRNDRSLAFAPTPVKQVIDAEFELHDALFDAPGGDLLRA